MKIFFWFFPLIDWKARRNFNHLWSVPEATINLSLSLFYISFYRDLLFIIFLLFFCVLDFVFFFLKKKKKHFLCFSFNENLEIIESFEHNHLYFSISSIFIYSNCDNQTWQSEKLNQTSSGSWTERFLAEDINVELCLLLCDIQTLKPLCFEPNNFEMFLTRSFPCSDR